MVNQCSMKVGCVCYRMPYDKLIENIKKIEPKDASDFSHKCLAGSACGMCVPYIEKYIKECKMKTIEFYENQDIVVSTNSQIGEKSIVFPVITGKTYHVTLEPQGEHYTDITFGEEFPVVAFLVPNETFKVIA